MADERMKQGVELGTWLGRREAFAQLAGRCSAADAACLKRMREERQYRELGMNWELFCKRKLGISKRGADLIIAQLNEFGPAYFLLAQVARVTPEEYRRISGAVRGQALLHAGQEIPIEAGNAGRLAEAIGELRRGQNAGDGDAAGDEDGAATKAAAEVERAFEKAGRGVNVALKEFERLVGLRLPQGGGGRMRLLAELGRAAGRLQELYQASWK